jgi:hypothetical protein
MDYSSDEDRKDPERIFQELMRKYSEKMIVPNAEKMLYLICEKHHIDIEKEFMSIIEDKLKKQKECVHSLVPLEWAYKSCSCKHCDKIIECWKCFPIAEKHRAYEHRYAFKRNYVTEKCSWCHNNISYTTCTGCNSGTCWCSCRYGCSCD